MDFWIYLVLLVISIGIMSWADETMGAMPIVIGFLGTLLFIGSALGCALYIAMWLKG